MDARLERQLAEIKAAGDPLSLADLTHRPIPPEKNAATYLRQAEPEVTAIDNEIGQWNDKEKIPEFWNYLGGERRPMPEKMHKDMKAIYAAHPKLIVLLQKAVECPDYDAHLDYSVPPEQLVTQLLAVVQNARGTARVFAYRTRLLVIDGDRDEAVRMALATFRLARHLDRSPLLVSYLVALAIRGMAVEEANLALQAGPVSKEVRQALDGELAIQERMAGYAWTIKSDRAYGLDEFRSFSLRNFWLYNRGRWNRQESEYLEVMKAFLALPNNPQPYHAIRSQIGRAYANILAGSGTFAQQIFPALQATNDAVMRVQATMQCLRVLNALQNRVAAGSDKIPAITELGLPATTITDPFNGEHLHIKKLPQGWVVYSVGSNERDDGGNLDMHDMANCDFGVGPPEAAAKK
jgi:hypothetical protein